MTIEEKIIAFITDCDSGTIITQSMISRYTKLSKPTVGKYVPLLLLSGKLSGLVNVSSLGAHKVMVKK
ncbi:MAG: hypothetical protein PWP52_2342 [Bacteroidales bacterium]|nr:hypothetical protein [Bacteroidales bacterium]